MEYDVKKIWKLIFVTKIAYRKYNIYFFLIYMIVRYKSVVSLCYRYIMGEIPRYMVTGTFKVKFLPSNLHQHLIKEQTFQSYSGDMSNTIVVPYDYFVKFSTENVAYRDGNTVWAAITAYSEDSIVNRISIDSGDIANIKRRIDAIVNQPHQFQVISSNRKFILKSDNDRYYMARIVQIVASHHLKGDSIYVTEQEHFNLKRKFGIHFGDDDFLVKFTPIVDYAYVPKIAKHAEICSVNSQYDIGTDLLDTILSRFFEKPILLHEGDVFGVPLIDKYMAQYSSKSLDITRTNGILYFKCIKLKSDDKPSVLNINDTDCKDVLDLSLFLLKDCTQLVLNSSINCMVPKERTCSLMFSKSLLHIDHCMLDFCPYGLDKEFSNINRSIRPFLMEKSVSPIHTLLKLRPNPIFLLSGPDGCGKTILARVLPFHNGVNRIWFDCHEIMCTTAKQTESKIDHIVQLAKNCSPVIVVLRNFQVFAVDFERNEDLRLVDYFSKRITDLFENFTKNPIIFLALTNTDELKPGISRIFLDRFYIFPPSKEERVQMLEWFILAKNITVCDSNFVPYNKYSTEESSPSNRRLQGEVYELFEKIAAKTNTFLFGDLDFLTTKAMECALNFHVMNTPDIKNTTGYVRLEDFDNAIESIRGMQSENLDAPKIPKVYWDDIGGMEELKNEILRTIELPIKYPHLLRNAGLKRSGVLMYGPPGCGKTLVAKALSTELKISFMSVKGPELLNMYVGQSEENVRKVFSVARSSAPCLIFLDELDALAPSRGSVGDSGGVADRVVSQLLAELDGVTNDTSHTSAHVSQPLVFVMGATNRPDLIEQSLLRPGRLDKLIYVGPYQGLQQKTKVVAALCRPHKLDDSVILTTVANGLPDRCTGADIMQVVNAARMEAVRRIVAPTLNNNTVPDSSLTKDDVVLNSVDFEHAIDCFIPSITEEDFDYFDRLKIQISG